MSNVNFDAFPQSFDNYVATFYQEIAEKMRFGDRVSQFFTTYESDGVFKIPNSVTEAVLQNYQTPATPKGNVTISPVIIKTDDVKLNFPYDPDTFYKEWVSHIQRGRITPETHPLERFILDKVIKRWISDVEATSAKGNTKPIVANVASQAKHAFTGFYTVVKRLIKSGAIVPVKATVDASAAPAWTADTILEYVEDFSDSIEEVYQNVEMPLLMSKKNRRLYTKDYRAEFGTGTNLADASVVVNEVFDTGMYAEWVHALSGLNFMMATPIENGIKTVSTKNRRQVRVQREYQEEWIFASMGFGFGFVLPEIVFVAGEMIEAPTAVDAADILATSATAKWNEVPEATGYRLDVSTAADFSSFVSGFENKAIDLSSLTAETVTIGGTETREYRLSDSITGLTTATQYYYRVRAEMQTDDLATTYTSQHSNVITFTTA